MSVVGNRARIAEALDYHLTQLVLSPVRRIAHRNKTFDPVDAEIYLKPTFMPARSDYAAVGLGLRRFLGLYQVSVVGPVNVSPVPQDEIADIVADFFEAETIARNSVRVQIGTIGGNASGGVPHVEQEIIADGWRTVPVSIPWWCDVAN